MAGQIISRGKNVWLVRIFLGRDPRTGKRLYRGKTVHGTKKAAEKYLHERLLQRHGPVVAGIDNTLIGALLDGLVADYETNGKSAYWAKLVVRVHLRPYFGAMKASALGSDDMHAYISHRRRPSKRQLAKKRFRTIRPASNATINRELALLRRAFNLGKNSTPPKVASIPKFPMLAENNVRKGFFEDADFVAMRRALPEEIRPVITFAYYTGCRKGEILNLRWSQVDLAERSIRLEPGETKNREARLIFMAPELFESLKMQKAQRDEIFPECPWVFARAGERIRDFKTSWKSACIAAGLSSSDGKPDRLFHDLRRTGVRNLVRAGVSERVAMKISGHKTRAVFDRYNIVSESDLRDAARRQGVFVEEKRTPSVDRHTTGTQASPPRVS